MPKKTLTAVGSLGDGMPVKMPVSVTTVWAEAVVSEAATKKRAAKIESALQQTGAFVDMDFIPF
jgi:hypothetical protein